MSELLTTGDFIKYVLKIKNNTQYSITGYDLYDILPPSFNYVESSAVINYPGKNKYQSEPNGDRILIWENLDIGSR
ncbi:MAG: hypothetical protein U5K53_08550 [Halanaerobiales bacterium]|nr:hypothetical protein [Halanaerobiales bacterium]